MKKKSIAVIASMAVLLGLASSIGAVPHGVRYTRHNLGATQPPLGSQFKATNETGICVFCHTPHNAIAGKKYLWNHKETTATFQMYTASPTLTNAAKGAVISEISKMCMSCHDGATALNSMANPAVFPINWQGFGAIDLAIGDIYDGGVLGWGKNIGEGIPGVKPGGNLTNDHPISFSYTAARTEEGASTTLKDINIPKGEGLVFWGNDMVECVTCHDPHINYEAAYGGDGKLKPFLRRSNASSNLCFACHNK